MERSQAFLILSCVALLQLPDQACQATAQFPSNFNGGVRGCFAKTNEIVDGTFGLKLVLQNTCNGHLQGLTAIFDVRGTARWRNLRILDQLQGAGHCSARLCRACARAEHLVQGRGGDLQNDLEAPLRHATYESTIVVLPALLVDVLDRTLNFLRSLLGAPIQVAKRNPDKKNRASPTRNKSNKYTQNNNLRQDPWESRKVMHTDTHAHAHF
jgi:hypothetical protein